MSAPILGPENNSSYIVPTETLNYTQASTRYYESLELFYQYVIWRYTIGSGSINSKLIFGTLSPNSTRWVYLFLLYYRHTISKRGLCIKPTLPKSFKKYLKYFETPGLINDGSSKSLKAVEGIIDQYTFTLQELILNAPAVGGGGIYVYKTAIAYPGLPDPNNFVPTKVFQLPFNSTTVLDKFNFGLFLSQTQTNYLFRIFIPPGNKVLYVPQLNHAYPFEVEVILPHSCTFNIVAVQNALLNYIDPLTVNVDRLQKRGDVSMGPVFETNQYKPCFNNVCDVLQGGYYLFDTIYENCY